MQLPAEFERQFGADLIGPVGERGHEAEQNRGWREAVPVPFQQSLARLRDEAQRVADSLSQGREIAAGPAPERFRAMTGNADRKHERDRRRAERRRFPTFRLDNRGNGRVHELSLMQPAPLGHAHCKAPPPFMLLPPGSSRT
jgi:hypothetical protein